MDEIQSPAPAQKPKRKTVTSSAVKKRYNDKTYNQYAFKLRKDSEQDAFIIHEIERRTSDGTPAGVIIKSILYEYFNGGK